MVSMKTPLLVIILSLGTVLPALASLPQRAQVLAGIRSSTDGLNCWGTTLYTAGLRKHVTYASDKEFTRTLDSKNLCRKLNVGEKIIAGAVGAIRSDINGSLEELHGFLVLNGDAIFTKKDFTYQTTSEIRSMKKDFSIFAELAKDQDATFEKCGPQASATGLSQAAKSCSTWIDFYVCEPGKGLSAEIGSKAGRELDRELQSIILEVESLYKSGSTMSSDQMNAMIERMSPLMSKIMEHEIPAEKEALFVMYESLAYQFTSVYLEQKTKSEIRD